MSFLQGCAKEEPDAAFELAKCYQSGLGVAKDDAMADYWFRHAGDMGHQDAQMELTNKDDTSDGRREKYELYMKRAKAGDAEAHFKVPLPRHGMAVPVTGLIRACKCLRRYLVYSLSRVNLS